MHNTPAKKIMLRQEYAVVIICDTAWGPGEETVLLKQYDGTHPVDPFRFKLTPYGSARKLYFDKRENVKKLESSEQAIARRFSKELPGIQEEVCRAMEYWKTFRLRWEPSVDEKEGEYTCHVYVMMLTEKYHLNKLHDRAFSVPDDETPPVIQGVWSPILAVRIKEMIQWHSKGYCENHFMGHREKILVEFLKTLDEMGAENFIEDLKQQNAS